MGVHDAGERPRAASRPQDGSRAAAFDSGPHPALVIDSEGALRAANAAAEELFGQALSRFSRRHHDRSLGEGDPLGRLIAQARSMRQVVQARGVALRSPDQPAIEADVVVTPLPGDQLLVTLSPSVQPAAEERRADVLRSAAGMGRTLAHEIKNPLAGIRGAAQLLALDAGAADAALAELIVEETDRIRRLVDRVELFSDDSVPDRSPVNIHKVLDRVRTLVSAGLSERVLFREAYDPSLPDVLGDEDQLIQIFLNLVKNAAEAIEGREDGRGEIVLTTTYRHGGRRQERDAAPPPPLEVRVQDNGPGVSRGVREHLFEPFVTTKAQGTGLGLTLVAKLVAGQQGQIDFQSEPGRTVFRVWLPIATLAAHPSAAQTGVPL